MELDLERQCSVCLDDMEVVAVKEHLQQSFERIVVYMRYSKALKSSKGSAGLLVICDGKKVHPSLFSAATSLLKYVAFDDAADLCRTP